MRHSPYLDLFLTFGRIGLFTFGGGYAMIPLIQREAVDNKGWISQEDLLDVIAIAESTPGPIAINSSTFIGSKVAGKRGAACATIIARFVEMTLFIAYVNREKPPFFGGRGDRLRTDWTLFGAILRRGGLMLFSEVLWVISETVTTAVYNGRGGADVVSGMSAGWAIVNLLFVSFGGINTATSVIIGKTLGEGKLDEARKQKTWMLSAAVVFGLFMSLMGGVVMLLVPAVFGNLSPAAQEICRSLVLLASVYMPVWIYNNVQFSVARAGGDTVMGAVVDGSVTLCIVIPGILLLARWTDWGPVLMYGVLRLTDFLKILIAQLWLKKERWVKNLTVQDAV